MKPNRLLAQFMVLVLLVSCSADSTEPDTPKPEPPQSEEPEEETPKPYLTVNVDSEFVSKEDTWIIVHDANGKLLDYDQLEQNQILEFSAVWDTISGPLSITQLNVSVWDTFSPDPPNNPIVATQYSLTTQENVELGKVLDITDPLASPEDSGEFTLQLNNLPLEDSESGIMTVGATLQTPVFSHLVDQDITVIPLKAFNTTTDVLISLWKPNDQWEYVFLEDVPPENTEVDFSANSQPFDDVAHQIMPENNGFNYYITGFEEGVTPSDSVIGEGQFLYCAMYSDFSGMEELQLPYLDRFKNYWIQFAINLPSFHYQINHGGDKLESISIPATPQFQVTQDDIANFSFSTELPLDHTWHTWETTQQESTAFFTTQWSVSLLNQNSFMANPLPHEILDQYPKMDIDGLTYRRSQVYVGENLNGAETWDVETYSFIPNP